MHKNSMYNTVHDSPINNVWPLIILMQAHD